MTEKITGSMKDGVVQYGDTFLEGKVQNQRATEQRLTEAIRYYSAVETQDYVRGFLVAIQIVKGQKMVPRNTGRV